MEQLEFDCRLESERELEENVNIALEFACKQVKETSKSKVSNRHDLYEEVSNYTTPVEDYLEGQFEDAEADPEAEAEEEQEDTE